MINLGTKIVTDADLNIFNVLSSAASTPLGNLVWASSVEQKQLAAAIKLMLVINIFLQHN